MASEELELAIGLMNVAGRFLTAEQFGFKINASATTLRKKQKWTLEHGDENIIYLRSHLDRYLTTDRKGNVSCSATFKGAEQEFTIGYCTVTGRWLIRNKSGLYLTGYDDKLTCTEKSPKNSEWTVQLARHPQTHLMNANRRRFAKMEGDNLVCKETIPWGSECIITIEFKGSQKEMRYCLKSIDNRYLHRDGLLVEECCTESLFSLEVRSGAYCGIALKDCEGRYLTAVGKGTMLAKNKSVSKDELFILEATHPQGFFKHSNGKQISIRQGVSLSANQDRMEDEELHRIEYDPTTSNWSIRSHNGKLWTIVSAGIEATGLDDKKGISNLFHIQYITNPENTAGGCLFIKFGDKFISAKKTGCLNLVADKIGDMDTEKFTFCLKNKPILILLTEFGYIGCKSPSNSKLECNKSNYEEFQLEFDQLGRHFIKCAATNKRPSRYWKVTAGGINADGEEGEAFYLEFVSQSRLIIRTMHGTYVKCEQNGTVSVKPNHQSATVFEY